MSFTCRPTSAFARWAAARRASSSRASRKAVNASSGNFASIARGRASPGMRIRQSGRELLESLPWNSNAAAGSPSRTIASMRPCPKAPRACLLERTSRSETTASVMSTMRACAASITASRSPSFARCSEVVRACASSPCPTRWLTESSRSATSRANSPCRDPSISPSAPSRPCNSPLACAIELQLRFDFGDLALLPTRARQRDRQRKRQQERRTECDDERLGDGDWVAGDHGEKGVHALKL